MADVAILPDYQEVREWTKGGRWQWLEKPSDEIWTQIVEAMKRTKNCPEPPSKSN
jgi:hypothetical protein